MPDAKTCFYCARRPEAPERTHRVPLHRSTPPHDLSVTLDVPRCGACARAHGRELFVVVLFFLVGALAGIACYFMISEALARAIGVAILVYAFAIGFGVVGGILGMLVGMPIGRLVRGRCRSLDDEPTAIAALVADGWLRGAIKAERRP